ncbi:MAG: azurin [Candidatus Nitrosomirales archaeon]|jgi:azurin
MTISVNQVVGAEKIRSIILDNLPYLKPQSNDPQLQTPTPSQPQTITQSNNMDEAMSQQDISLSNNVAKTEVISNKKIKFSTIYLSLRKSCVEREIELMQFTHWMAEQYLHEYGYDIGKTNMQCIFLDDFMNGNFDQSLVKDRDFVVLPTNALQAMQVVAQKYVRNDYPHNEPVPFAGVYSSARDNKTDIILFEAYKSESTAWILSHEMAHMILFWKGNPQYRDGVHDDQNILQTCYPNWAQCPEIWLTIEYPYKPYKQKYYMMDVRSFLLQ